MSPPTKVEVKGKTTKIQMLGQYMYNNLIVYIGRNTGIDTTYLIGLGFSWRRTQLKL